MNSNFISFTLLVSIGLVVCKDLGRIVGGDDAVVRQFPHQVSLQVNNGWHSCGGSIISKNFILTAAHCVVATNSIEPDPAKFFKVRVGSIQYWAGGQLRDIKKVTVHKKFDPEIFAYDIALMELKEPLVFTEKIKPIAIAKSEPPSGAEVTISGWGRLTTYGASPTKLQWAKVIALNRTDCKEHTDEAHESTICLYHEAEKGACFGDSGGPASYNNTLIGASSWVLGGCGFDTVDGYTNIFYHYDWIISHVTDELL